MKTLWILLALLPFTAQASPLGKAFSAYVKMKRAESLPGSPLQAAALTEARISFYEVLESRKEEGWEKDIISRWEKKRPPPPQVDPTSLQFLEKNFSQPRELSALEWEAIQDWFGPATQEEFLRRSFGLNELPTTPAPAKLPRLVWVLNPYQRLLKETDDVGKKEVQALGLPVELLELSPFPKMEEQAEELKGILLGRQEEPVVLISSGDATAIVHKMFDLYPGLRELGSIRGWINMNGRLYGKPSAKNRSPASIVSASSAADQFEESATLALKMQRMERLERPSPLGGGFPIVNIISLDKAHRPVNNLREALIGEGSSWFVNKGAAWKNLPAALKVLEAGP